MPSVRRRPRRTRLLVSLVGITAMVLTLVTAIGVGRAAAAGSSGCHPYPDVDSSNSACANITWLKTKDITRPADGRYHPKEDVTRGQMAAFLYRLKTHGAPAPKCTTKPFPDVSTSNVFCGYIAWAKKTGVTVGYPNGTYGPSKKVTRGAMAAYLRRIVTETPTPKCVVEPFKDVKTTDTFCGVITWMVANGITYGVGGGKYGTALPVTRQAMASFLHRVSEYKRHINPQQGATEAARVQFCPDAIIVDLKVVDGFAYASLRCPSAGGQTAAGNDAYFKVYGNGSMTLLAVVSDLSPIDLLNLGIPLKTQAKFREVSYTLMKQYLADSCGYTGGNVPGYTGFDASFPPSGWQLSAGEIYVIQEILSDVLGPRNAGRGQGNKTICVDAVFKSGLHQGVDTDWTLKVEFITGDGAVSTHTIGWTWERGGVSLMTLDGKKIS